MASCPKLCCQNGGIMGSMGYKYICAQTGKRMSENSVKANVVCNADIADIFKKCPEFSQK